MSATELDALFYRIEQLGPSTPPVSPVNGAFTDPRQIARVLRDLYTEDWQYCGSFHVGGQDGDIHMLGCGDKMRPIYRDSQGRWYTAYKDRSRYGEPDRAGTLMLLAHAQENGL